MNAAISPVELPAAIGAPSRTDHWQSAETVLRRAGRDCLDHLLRNEAASRAGDLEGIHQMRVAVRRLRAILSALAPVLPPEPRRRISNELRWLADALGEARNLDVLALEIVAPACAALPPTDGLERLTRAVERHRQYAHAEVEATINSGRYAASVRALSWFDEGGWHGQENFELFTLPIGELAPIVLERLYRLIKKRKRRFAKQSEEQCHRFRIALKKMRYAAELLSFLYDQAASNQFIQRTKRLQDDLGYRNDVRVGRDLMASLINDNPLDADMMGATQSIVSWHKHHLADDEPRLGRRVRQLFTIEPFWSYGRMLRSNN